MTCIYCCRTEEETDFESVEHVIPQAFGTFGNDTPTLDCVCDECNNTFGRTIDQTFARDSLEGITRYRRNRFSRERRPLTRLRLTLDEGEETGDLAGAVSEGVDGTNGRLLLPIPQFHILNRRTDNYDVFAIEEIAEMELPPDVYGEVGHRETKIIAGSREDHDRVINALREAGIEYNIRETFGAPFVEGREDDDEVIVPVHIEGTIDNTIKRALVKTLINFAAYYVGPNEVLKTEWNDARDFVNGDTEEISGRRLMEPFWGDETETLRLQDDSVNVIIENKNQVGVVGRIQFYNLFTYEFILASEYYIPNNHEAAARFTPGQPPQLAEKRIV